MEFILYISGKINPLQSVVVLAAAILISSFFGFTKKKVFKKFIIAVGSISLFLAFCLNIYVFISMGAFSDSLLTFGIMQVIEAGIIIFAALNLLFFISAYELNSNHFVKILILLLFSTICAVFIVISENFILMFTSLTIFILTIFQLVTSLNSSVSKTGSYTLRYFLRPALTVILFLFGFSLFYGASDFKNLGQILVSENISNPLTVLGLIIFGVAVYLYFFLFPFQNPYLGLMKRARSSSNSVIWFLYFPAGFFMFLKFSELYSFYIEKSSLYTSVIFIIVTFICMFAANLGAVKTGSIRRIMSFLFLYFIGVFLLNISMFSTGIISKSSMEWLNIAGIFLLVFSFIPIYSVFSRIERDTGSDSIAGIRGFGRSNIYISVNLLIIFLSWSVIALYIIPFGKYFNGMVFSEMGAANMMLLAVIAVVFLFLMVNVFRIISVFYRKPAGGAAEKIIFPKYFYIYITFFTLAILIITVWCLMEISCIETGFMDFKITEFSF